MKARQNPLGFISPAFWALQVGGILVYPLDYLKSLLAFPALILIDRHFPPPEVWADSNQQLACQGIRNTHDQSIPRDTPVLSGILAAEG